MSDTDDLDAAAARLWQFAVALYEMEGVKAACLSIQARYGISISLLLGAVWAGGAGYGRLGATDLETAIRRGVEWHREIIEPMRSLRRRLRQAPPKGLEKTTERLRRAVLDQELEAERIQQRLFLEDFPAGCTAAPEPERWRDAAANAALYTRKSCPRPEREALDALVLILQTAFPDVSAGALAGEAEAVWQVR
ncbi:TIGR02444 family protein [Sediminicurvatus halobius]|uniref:TIGR02444 family protein n=1 Tax=Sediminicurvatus halobius TaxID=2182432 RepID=A0A2U2N7B7_9GAMM|nr:TIGR02444 family protein [Spiribacter halobius]PWG64854.1 TIGR02444 family protein [Spiribacter halobius]UEX78292.1 TIGR02444 family protein [Spiribacter halobius]